VAVAEESLLRMICRSCRTIRVELGV